MAIVGYLVGDVERSVAFYTEHLGFKLDQKMGMAFARVAEMPKPMMHVPGKSDRAIVAKQPANAIGRPVVELVERRAGAEGNADEDGRLRTPSRIGLSPGLVRVRRADHFGVRYPRWEPDALIGPVRFCAGGASGDASYLDIRFQALDWIKGAG